MKKFLLVLSLLILIGALLADYEPQSLLFKTNEEILINGLYADSLNTNRSWFNDLSQQYKIYYLENLYSFTDSKGPNYWYYCKYKDNLDAQALVDIFQVNENVLYAELNIYGELCSDPLQSNQWYLNTVKMNDVWSDPLLNYYGDNIVVGVVDTGIDLGTNTTPPTNNIHPDLYDNLQELQYQTSYYYGYNAMYPQNQFPSFAGSRNVQDYIGHGTAVAGIIGAIKNNGVGISGIAGGNYETLPDPTPGCKLFSIKVGGTSTTYELPIVNYARGVAKGVELGIQLFNCSSGFLTGDHTGSFGILDDLLLNPSNGLFVCSAGNFGPVDSTPKRVIPASLGLSVAATDVNDTITQYSSYSSTVDICAPGDDKIVNMGIYTTTPQDPPFFKYSYGSDLWSTDYSYVHDTSMAAAIVTGAAVLVKEKYNQLSMQEVGDRILGTADDISQMNPDYKYIGKLGAGRLNIYRALTEDPHPTLRLRNVDGPIYCGELNYVNICLKNWWTDFDMNNGSISGVLSFNDPYIQIIQSTTTWDVNEINDFGEGYCVWNSLQIQDNSIVTNGDVEFQLTLTYTSGTYSKTEILYFNVPRSVNFSVNPDLFTIENRELTSSLVIDDINGDGLDEIALTTSNSGNGFVNLFKQDFQYEYQLNGISNVKPCFADMNWDGVKDIVIIDNSGSVYILDENLALIADYHMIFLNSICKSFAVEDLNNDGQLDIAIALQNSSGASFIKALIFTQDFQYHAYNYVLPISPVNYKILNNIAIANVDDTPQNEILYLEGYQVTSSPPSNYYYYLVKLTLIDDHIVSSNSTQESAYFGTDELPSDFGFTDILIIKPHPTEMLDMHSYIYFGMGFSYFDDPQWDLLALTRSARYKVFCYDFSTNNAQAIWVRNFSQTLPSEENYVYTPKNIIAGDFITTNPGIEIISGYSEQILDSETGNCLHFIKTPSSSAYSTITSVQPAIMSDFNSDSIQELFTYRGCYISLFDAFGNSMFGHDIYIPGDKIVSLVAGKVRDNGMYELYALSLSMGAVYIYIIPYSISNEQELYECRQFNANSRSTGAYYQPIPNQINSDLLVWNDCIIENDTKIGNDYSVIFDKGINIRVGKYINISNAGELIFDGEADNPITISGMCADFINNFWIGISSINNSLVNIEHLNFKNASNGLSLYDNGIYNIVHSNFENNEIPIIAYSSTLDLGYDYITDSFVGICGYNKAHVNMGHTVSHQGYNTIESCEQGIYDNYSSFYLDQGLNNFFENELFNITTDDLYEQVEARENWWGSDIEEEIREKFYNFEDIIYENWCHEPNTIPTKDNEIDCFKMAEAYRINSEWNQAIPLYMSVFNDTLYNSKDYMSVTGMLQCYVNLNQLITFKSWLINEISEVHSSDMIKHLKGTLALVNRNLGLYQDALDYYESILDNNPSYNDSCFAVIDIGFTWLEANNAVKGKYSMYKPKSMPDHITTSNRLLNSILLKEPITNDAQIPLVPVLYQNYPNPFNPTTIINFSLPSKAKVELTVYNIKGQKVTTLISSSLDKGKHSIVWDSKDKNGKAVSSGVYFYKLKTPNNSIIKKCLLLK